MRSSDVVERFWRAKPCRLGSRDAVVVEGSTVRYFVWGNQVARWDRDADVLEVDDCGWQTYLTKDRLNKILYRINFEIYSLRGRWYIHNAEKGESYVWKGRHTIHLQTGLIEPAQSRFTHPKISKRLKNYYERALNILDARRRMLITPTLDGVAYIFVEEPREHTQTILVKMHSPEFDVWEGQLKHSTILSAFTRNSPERILRIIGKNFRKVGDDCKLEYLIKGLTQMGFTPEALPKDLVSALATAKILEG
jgi:hypothetical protein